VIEGIAKGVALRAAGRTDEATRLITAAPEESLLGGLTHMFYLGDVLEALIESGQVTVIEELLAHRVHAKLPLTRGQLHRARGLLQAQRGDYQQAEAELAEAVLLIGDSGNPFALARSMQDHGQILVELGRTEEATAVLRRVRSMFGRLRAQPWIERTDHLLEPPVLGAE
jgi:tetratricopeptide (TPR) repeat protein